MIEKITSFFRKNSDTLLFVRGLLIVLIFVFLFIIKKIISFFRKNSATLLFVVGLLVLIAVFFLIDHFNKSDRQTLWEKLEMFGSVVVGMASATIAYLVYDYNRKRQEEERQLRLIETATGLHQQLFSKDEEEKIKAFFLVKYLNDKFASQVLGWYLDTQLNGRKELIELIINDEKNPDLANKAQELYRRKYYNSLELTECITTSGTLKCPDKPQKLWYIISRGDHTLELPSKFYMGIYPITNKLFLKFVQEDGYEKDSFWKGTTPENRKNFHCQNRSYGPRFWPSENGCSPGKEDHPVVGICYYEAKAFCQWLQERYPPDDKSRCWCLPTEDMWEFVARGGNPKRSYPWGTEFNPKKCNCKESGIGKTTSVTEYPGGKSKDGCYDMVGNVWEFVEAKNPEESKHCIMRGGAYKTGKNAITNEFHLVKVTRTNRANDFGFRVAQVYLDPNNTKNECD